MPYAYMAGDNCYGRGDYYRGDYYRGDPGIFGALKKIGAAAFSAIKTGFAAGPIGIGIAATKALVSAGAHKSLPAPSASLVAGGPAAPASLQIAAQTAAQYGIVNVSGQHMGPPELSTGIPMQPTASLTPGGALVPCQLKGYRVNKTGYYRHPRGEPQSATYVPAHSVCVKTRHMNPANGRALRRALTRAYAFKRIALRTLHLLNPTHKKRFGGFKKRKGSHA